MGMTTTYWVHATWSGTGWLIEIPAIKGHPVLSTMRYRDIERDARPLVERHSVEVGSPTRPVIEIRPMLPSTGSRNIAEWSRRICMTRSAETISDGMPSRATRYEERLFVETLHRAGVPVIDMAEMLRLEMDQVQLIANRVSGKSEHYRANAVYERGKGWCISIPGVEHEPVYARSYTDIHEMAVAVIHREKDVYPELSFTMVVGDVTLPGVSGITSVIKRGEYLGRRLKEAALPRTKDHANWEAAEFALQLDKAGVSRQEGGQLLDVWDAGFSRLLALGKVVERLRDNPVPMRSDGEPATDPLGERWRGEVLGSMAGALRTVSSERAKRSGVAMVMPSGSSDFSVKSGGGNRFGFPTGVAIGHVYRSRSIDWLWTGAQWFPLPDESQEESK